MQLPEVEGCALFPRLPRLAACKLTSKRWAEPSTWRLTSARPAAYTCVRLQRYWRRRGLGKVARTEGRGGPEAALAAVACALRPTPAMAAGMDSAAAISHARSPRGGDRKAGADRAQSAVASGAAQLPARSLCLVIRHACQCRGHQRASRGFFFGTPTYVSEERGAKTAVLCRRMAPRDRAGCACARRQSGVHARPHFTCLVSLDCQSMPAPRTTRYRRPPEMHVNCEIRRHGDIRQISYADESGLPSLLDTTA